MTEHEEHTEDPESGITYQYVPWRGVTADTMEFYGVRSKVLPDGRPDSLGFLYGNGRTKIRSRESKSFRYSGERTGETGYIFGMDRFAPGSARAITITEGEMDALATFQMLGSKYPVVSVSSATAARSDCTRDYDYLNSFERIYLAFDSDEVGQAAVNAVASLFDFNKIYHVRMDKKDPLEYLEHGDNGQFSKVWWAAKRFLPEGVISTWAEMDSILDNERDKESIPYPLEKLNSMTYGIRTGELVLFTAMEGIGKTETFRLLEHHILSTTDANIGIIHLEEGKGRIIKGLAGYVLQTPAHLPDSQVSNDDIKKAFRSLTRRDERVHIYTHFGSDDPDVILNTIRFLAGPCGCKYVFLDHITMVVTGLQGDDERKQLDYISTKLAMMVEEQDFTCFLISHVNDEGQTRGSRNISKVADLHVHLDRDSVSPVEEVRNQTKLTVRKNRFAGKTGPAGMLVFDPSTFMLHEELELPA